MSASSLTRQLTVMDTVDVLTHPAPARPLEAQVRDLYARQGLTVDPQVLHQAVTLEASSQPATGRAPAQQGKSQVGTKPSVTVLALCVLGAGLMSGTIVGAGMQARRIALFTQPVQRLTTLTSQDLAVPSTEVRIKALGLLLAQHAKVNYLINDQGNRLLLEDVSEADCQAMAHEMPVAVAPSALAGTRFFINGNGRQTSDDHVFPAADLCMSTPNNELLFDTSRAASLPSTPGQTYRMIFVKRST